MGFVPAAAMQLDVDAADSEMEEGPPEPKHPHRPTVVDSAESEEELGEDHGKWGMEAAAPSFIPQEPAGDE